jgi:biotin--protein ligase
VAPGCGLNLNTHEPLLSLASLIPHGHLSAERTLAVVLGTFERMWNQFVEGAGSFVPFEQLYLSHWLHSCVPLSLVLN